MAKPIHHDQMRPKVVVEYILRGQHDRKESWRIIRERDQLLLALNKQYGIADRNGNYGIGKHGGDEEYWRKFGQPAKDAEEHKANFDQHVEERQEHWTKYDQIDNKYQALLDAIGDKEKKAKVNLELSVWEYLLFDNISTEAQKKVFEVAQAHENEGWYDFTSVRADAQIKFYSNNHNIGGIRDMIAHERRDFAYRAARCKKRLRIGLFDLSAQIAITRFKSKYIGSLTRSFELLEVD